MKIYYKSRLLRHFVPRNDVKWRLPYCFYGCARPAKGGGVKPSRDKHGTGYISAGVDQQHKGVSSAVL